MKLKIMLFIVLSVFAICTISITSIQPLTFSDLPLNLGNLLRSIFNTGVALAKPMSGGPGGIR
jgi:hypothetical protein